MPPKRKRVSSAISIRQAKKRKQKQRQRELQCLGSPATSETQSSSERRRKRDAMAHRLVRLDDARRQQDQERNTAARRQVRVNNPLRRSEEQVYCSCACHSIVIILCLWHSTGTGVTRLLDAEFGQKTQKEDLKSRFVY